MELKLFWTWDHCTNWTLNIPGNQNCGSGNAYTKHPGVFLQDYKRAVDWCASNGIDGIGIVGLLRDRHGGVDTARELCTYAREHGVRIYIIAGLYGYGGIYYEGNHKYCLDRFLEKNPDCTARGTDGSIFKCLNYSPAGGTSAVTGGCPSSEKLKDFILESLDWLFKTIPELGGIQMEVGDLGVCQCEKCKAKSREDKTGYISFDAMSRIYPDAVKTVSNRSPDAWVICETYHHFMQNNAHESLFGYGTPEECLDKLTSIPENTFLQWVCDRQIADGSWNENSRLPSVMQKYRHIMRAHFGTYWSKHLRNALEVENIRKQCYLSHLSGLQGVSLFGESSHFHPNVEFNYLAFSYFTDHPMASIEKYADTVMAKRLGGKCLAEKYLNFASACREPHRILEIQKEIINILGHLKDFEQIRRWEYLASFLNAYYWESRQPDYMKGEIIKTSDINV
jgi:hypothetical protein